MLSLNFSDNTVRFNFVLVVYRKLLWCSSIKQTIGHKNSHVVQSPKNRYHHPVSKWNARPHDGLHATLHCGSLGLAQMALVIGRSHYNSQGRWVCSLASLYGLELGCGSHSFHCPTLIWFQSPTADTVAETDTHCCLCRNPEWEEENGVERSKGECQRICCFVYQTETMTLLVKLRPRGHEPYWRQKYLEGKQVFWEWIGYKLGLIYRLKMCPQFKCI